MPTIGGLMIQGASEVMDKPRLNDVTICSKEGYTPIFNQKGHCFGNFHGISEQKNLGMAYLEGRSASNELMEVLKRSGL